MKKSEEKAMWEKFRQEVIRMDGGRCVECGRTAAEGAVLQVHHKVYHPGLKLWEYIHDECETLCKGCHAALHGKIPPKDGWQFEFDEDLGDLIGECESCGKSLRYLFHISHEKWGALMEVGTDCCDRLTGTDEASSRANAMAKYAGKMKRFLRSPKWSTSQDGNRHNMNRHNHNISVFRLNSGEYWIRINDIRGKSTYKSLEEAKQKAFDVIETRGLARYLKRKNTDRCQ